MTIASNVQRLNTPAAALATALLVLAGAACPGGCGSSQDEEGKPAPAKRTARRARSAPAPAKDQPSGVGGYLETVVGARKLAETVADKVHMRALWTSLNTHAATNGGKLPDDLKALGSRALLNAPGADGQPYRYIGGQTTAMPRKNILVYEEKPVHKGRKVLVLRLDGTIELLTPDQLRLALAKTKGRLGKQ